jgi:hypothetical protein
MSEHLVSILLSSPYNQYSVGYPVPVNIAVRNNADHSLSIVGILDGSEYGLRFPYYIPEICFGDTKFPEPTHPKNHWVGPIRLSDFYRLSPGQTFDPTAHSFEHAYRPLATFTEFKPAQPGIYSFQLHLSTMSEDPEQWLGFFGESIYREAILERVMHIPRLKVSSNILEVQIT